jgi:hypothetical protein
MTDCNFFASGDVNKNGPWKWRWIPCDRGQKQWSGMKTKNVLVVLELMSNAETKQTNLHNNPLAKINFFLRCIYYHFKLFLKYTFSNITHSLYKFSQINKISPLQACHWTNFPCLTKFSARQTCRSFSTIIFLAFYILMTEKTILKLYSWFSDERVQI